jgi:hypothetical protein
MPGIHPKERIQNSEHGESLYYFIAQIIECQNPKLSGGVANA